MIALRIYLDNNATTQLAPEALAAMMPYFTDVYLNASSAVGELMHADQPIADAKLELAAAFGDRMRSDAFLLTSGASEANSWAVHAATWRREPGHILASAIEHPSLLAALDTYAQAGWAVELVNPMPDGRIDPTAFAARIRPDTTLVSVMMANNETGVIQPVPDIGWRLRDIAPGALFHVDATQAFGRIPLSLDDDLANVDLLSISAHKFHGPKGFGALFVADGRVPALIHGSQEAGQRGGTPNTAGAAGMAIAASLARIRLGEMTRVRALRDRFERDLLAGMHRIRLIGAEAERLPNTSAFCIPGTDAQEMVETLARDGIAIASGAACSSGSNAPSHVLTAMGIDYTDAKATLRVSLSHYTTGSEVDETVKRICEVANALVSSKV